MDEAWTTGVTSTRPSEPVTLESMIATVEELRKTLPPCWHHELITSEWLSTSPNGITYACAQCFKMFTVPASLLGSSEAPKRISIDILGTWRTYAKEQAQ